MRALATSPRLYLPVKLAPGTISLNAAQAHYLGKVLRLRIGDAVRGFNENDGEYACALKTLERKSATLTVKTQLRPPKPAPDIWLVFALIKKPRTDFILEKATELGVSQICPIITARTQIKSLNLDRANVKVIEAAEQTERLDLPSLQSPQSLEAILANWDQSRTLLFADETGAGEMDTPTAKVGIRNCPPPAAVLIGPEGGFSLSERDRLRALPYVRPIALGPRILRADTAALSLLTLWQAANGDWI